EPVLAGPPSSWYRLRKFGRRNRVALSAAVLAAAALVSMAVVSVIDANRQRDSAKRISGLVNELSQERESLRKSLVGANRLLAIRNFERGQAAFEDGQIGSGLLWMTQSWRAAVAAGDRALQHAARANLAAWRPRDPLLKAVLSHAGPVEAAAFSPDCRAV